MLTYQDVEKVFNKKIFNFIKQYSNEFHYKSKMFNYKPILVIDRKRNILFLKENFKNNNEEICFELLFPQYLYTKAKSKRAPLFFDIKFINKLIEETLKELKEINEKNELQGGIKI